MSKERPTDEGTEDSAALDAAMIDAARREVETVDKPEGADRVKWVDVSFAGRSPRS